MDEGRSGRLHVADSTNSRARVARGLGGGHDAHIVQRRCKICVAPRVPRRLGVGPRGLSCGSTRRIPWRAVCSK
jgi:hypothetical protein